MKLYNIIEVSAGEVINCASYTSLEQSTDHFKRIVTENVQDLEDEENLNVDTIVDLAVRALHYECGEYFVQLVESK